MDDRIRVMTIVGTRPEIIRLSRVIAVLEETTNHILAHTGQNYDHELSGVFFDELGLPNPKYQLQVAGRNAAETIGKTIIEVDRILEKELPDAVLVLGDTNSCLAVIPAKRRKIPIFHMEAGNRCFDLRVPEEINRRIVDHVSDVNLCYTEHARRNLEAEGLPRDLILKIGSPLKEVLGYYRANIEASSILERLQVKERKYFVVSIHREENVDTAFQLSQIIHSLNGLAAKYQFPLIFSVHPRTRQRLDTQRLALHHLIKPVSPFGYFDYIKLQKHCFCTISDSGTITEESSLLGFPAVTIRETHERPEGMDEAVVIMTGFETNRVLESVAVTLAQFSAIGSSATPVDYNTDRVSWKVVKTILGYRDYVRRRVWMLNTRSEDEPTIGRL